MDFGWGILTGIVAGMLSGFAVVLAGAAIKMRLGQDVRRQTSDVTRKGLAP